MTHSVARQAGRIIVGACLMLGTVSAALGQTPPPGEALEISDEQEARLLRLVTAPEGFNATVFAAPPINYPAAITAAPGGDLFVASDRNGSLDRERGRGQIFRVYDTDDDGTGDSYTVFVDSVDSPRGLVFDGQSLYVMHPPDLTVYRDLDGDGAADTSSTLVRGLGRSLDFRGADHTTNGMQMGIDGWIYIAVGDYGFARATGSDGQTIRYRGGAVVRVRPDGSELEIYATGTRNTYDVTLDSFLNAFARGNTNDGMGWDVRLHQLLPRANYGYPSLYTHFPEEIMPPLADYGGGSGAGALYVDAPGLPEPYDEALYTADWGVSQVFRHSVDRTGGLAEVNQEPFLQIPQPTDITIDGRSNMYVSSWYGAAFRYSGPDVGFVLRLRATGGEAGSTPDLKTASNRRLVELLTSSHQLYRLYAQRELLRRSPGPDVSDELASLAAGDQPVEVRIAALFTLKQLEGPAATDELLPLTGDPEIRAFVLRALADRKAQNAGVPIDPFLKGLEDPDPRVRREAVNGLARLDAGASAEAIIPLTADRDTAVAEIAVNALADLGAAGACLAAVTSGSTAEAAGALEALRQMHSPRAVNGLIGTLGSVERDRKIAVLSTLGRLYHREDEWNGTDWWGTQPDIRGPYFDPVEWSMSSAIEPVLRRALVRLHGSDLERLATSLERHRALPDSSANLITRSAEVDTAASRQIIGALVGELTVPAAAADVLDEQYQSHPSLQHAILNLLTAQPTIPESAADVLKQAALDETLDKDTRRRIMDVLYRSSPED